MSSKTILVHFYDSRDLYCHWRLYAAPLIYKPVFLREKLELTDLEEVTLRSKALKATVFRGFARYITTSDFRVGQDPKSYGLITTQMEDAESNSELRDKQNPSIDDNTASESKMSELEVLMHNITNLINSWILGQALGAKNFMNHLLLYIYDFLKYHLKRWPNICPLTPGLVGHVWYFTDSDDTHSFLVGER